MTKTLVGAAEPPERKSQNTYGGYSYTVTSWVTPSWPPTQVVTENTTAGSLAKIVWNNP